jgi:putative Ca2+/H+ antiporter (TMEM165/GDT1 family)
VFESLSASVVASGQTPVVASLTAFVVILLAEMGDKSQLVCMAMATRHRGLPVLLGAVAAFVLLNILAVAAGASVAQWVPEQALEVIVALLFGVFGVQALRSADHEEGEVPRERSGRGVFLTTFGLILVAEFGDKTQIAVAGMAGVAAPVAVWAGASLALAMTSGLGVWAGRTVLQRISVRRLHQAGGMLFILLSVLTLWQAFA